LEPVKLLLLGLLVSANFAAQEPKPQPAISAAVEEHIRAVVKTLPPDSMIRRSLEQGVRGDGFHYPWMDDMRRQGVKQASVEVRFVWFFGPRRMKVVRIMYFSNYSYEMNGTQITDEGQLEKIGASGLQDKLKAEALRRGQNGFWFEFDLSDLFWPFPGSTVVTLFDDEWLSVHGNLYSRWDPDESPLEDAIVMGDEVGVATFLAKGNISAEGLNHALLWASGSKDVANLRALLKAGANANVQDKDGDTPLIVAVRTQHPANVEVLLKAGARVNVRRHWGETPLTEAASRYDTRMVHILLDAGADVNAANEYGLTALMRATHRQPTSVLEALLRRGANVNARDHRGNTALIWAAESGNTAAVKVLLAARADLNEKNNEGQTALSTAMHNAHPEIVQLLEQARARQ